MQLLEKEQEVTSSEEFTQYSFGIKQSGFAHILNILRNQLYSDKLKAILREYGCNAYDAHISIGIEKEPFVISLPTRWEPTLSIRDFGPGLDEPQIADLFTQYGESTKRGCNKQTGQLGIGCKSGFSYGDSFMVVSRKNGLKTQYNAYLDESHIGKIAKMFEEPLQDSDRCGLEIIIPIRQGDVERVQDKAQAVFRYFTVPPKLVCGDDVVEVESYKQDTDEGGWYWKGRTNSASVYAVMGNIGYYINTESVAGLTREQLDMLGNNSMVIEFPMGSLNFSASREALEYTEATQKAICTRVQKIYDACYKKMQARFAAAKTLLEAKLLLVDLHDTALYPFSDYRRSKYLWNGIELTHPNFHTTDGTKVIICNVVNSKAIVPTVTHAKNSNGEYLHVETVQRINHKEDSKIHQLWPNAKTAFVIRKAATKQLPGSVSRKLLKLAIDKGVERIFVIQFENRDAMKEFYKENNFNKVPTYRFEKLDEISVTKAKKAPRKKTTSGWLWSGKYFYRHDIPHNENILYFVATDAKEGYGKSGELEVSTNFLQQRGHTEQTLLGTTDLPNVYMISARTKPKDNWIPLETYYKKQVAKKKKLVQQIQAGQYILDNSDRNLRNLDYLVSNWRSGKRNASVADLPLFKQFSKLKEDSVVLDTTAQTIICKLCLNMAVDAIQTNVEINKVMKQIYSEYPLLSLIEDRDEESKVATYINQLTKLKEYENTKH